MEQMSVYQNIAKRTKGDIYIGVVGPVRTGKSTFIKSFMEAMVLPQISDVYLKERAIDELPQSGSGKTIMTSEPKFVPEEAVRITLDGNAAANVRLIDCVGYMVDGALGEFEDDAPRMVSTPWFDEEISLRQAAETGTYKVITEHSTIGIVVTSDGSIGDITREAYFKAEQRIVSELKSINKPFIILLNSANPRSSEVQQLRIQIEELYGVTCVAQNCTQLQKEDIEVILKSVLYEFPTTEFEFMMPDWVSALPTQNPIRQAVYESVWQQTAQVKRLRDARVFLPQIAQCEYVESVQISDIGMADGTVCVQVNMPKDLFYQVICEQTGLEIRSDAQLIPMLCDMVQVQKDYQRIAGALEQVNATGYGIVMPTLSELSLEQPEMVRQGGRFGVKLKASAPSIHMIKANIETEISPIVGSEKQSEELVKYLMSEFEESPEKIWESNIFGKSLNELVNEGLNNKLYKMPDDARSKLQETLERIINEGSGGLICIIL